MFKLIFKKDISNKLKKLQIPIVNVLLKVYFSLIKNFSENSYTGE